MQKHRGRRDAEFYLAALTYGQSLWVQGKPAQSILQLNKAWSAELEPGDAVLRRWPPPYRALAWILGHAPEACFLGNPVRHFQHLATRVRGERAELRSWRAWACLHLSRAVRPELPFDEEQIRKESLVIPERAEAMEQLRRRGWEGEADVFGAAFEEALNF